MAPRSRSRSHRVARGVQVEAGMRFRIVGPGGQWAANPHRVGGWVPRAYTARPDDTESRKIEAHQFRVDFTAEFVADEVYAQQEQPKFVSVKTKARSSDFPDQYMDVWINVSKRHVSWIQIVP